jgi:hypothetical protein
MSYKNKIKEYKYNLEIKINVVENNRREKNVNYDGICLGFFVLFLS